MQLKHIHRSLLDPACHIETITFLRSPQFAHTFATSAASSKDLEELEEEFYGEVPEGIKSAETKLCSSNKGSQDDGHQLPDLEDDLHQANLNNISRRRRSMVRRSLGMMRAGFAAAGVSRGAPELLSCSFPSDSLAPLSRLLAGMRVGFVAAVS